MTMWVFGYGSLLWNPGFDVAESVIGTLPGYARSFCMRSIHHRGSEEEPGLVLALDQDLLHLARGDPIEEVRERNLAAGGRIASENLEDEHHSNDDHGPHEDGSYGLIHDPISSRRRPVGTGAKENLTRLPNLPPVR